MIEVRVRSFHEANPLVSLGEVELRDLNGIVETFQRHDVYDDTTGLSGDEVEVIGQLLYTGTSVIFEIVLLKRGE